MIRIGRHVFGRVDISGGRFTYGNRIALGDIFSESGKTAYYKLKDAFREVYGHSPLLLPPKVRVRRMNEILEGLSEWVAKEREMLAYTPTPDEEQAGVAEMTKRIGSMGTVDALAQKYSKDPDEILGWDYAKVFAILYSDLEKAKFQKRFDRVINAKYSGRNRKAPR